MVQRILFAVTGVVCLVGGIALVLSWWPLVVLLFKGVIGMTLALVGIVLLSLAKD